MIDKMPWKQYFYRLKKSSKTDTERNSQTGIYKAMDQFFEPLFYRWCFVIALTQTKESFDFFENRLTHSTIDRVQPITTITHLSISTTLTRMDITRYRCYTSLLLPNGCWLGDWPFDAWWSVKFQIITYRLFSCKWRMPVDFWRKQLNIRGSIIRNDDRHPIERKSIF